MMRILNYFRLYSRRPITRKAIKLRTPLQYKVLGCLFLNLSFYFPDPSTTTVTDVSTNLFVGVHMKTTRRCFENTPTVGRAPCLQNMQNPGFPRKNLPFRIYIYIRALVFNFFP